MTDREKAERLVSRKFDLSEEDLKEINGLFRPYLFRRSSTGEIWSTCCGKYVKICDRTWMVHERSAVDRLATREEKDLLYEYHVPQEKWNFYTCTNEEASSRRTQCPWCGRMASVKELRFCGRRKNLWEYQRAAVLRQREDGLWVQCYDCIKTYEGDLLARARLELLGVYRFCGRAMMPLQAGAAGNETILSGADSGPMWASAPTERYEGACIGGAAVAESARRQWDGSVWSFNEILFVGKRRKWMLSAPYGYCSDIGKGFSVVALSELRKSGLRWIGLEALKDRSDFLRLLSLACFYPRQMEWLHKLGLDEGIIDYSERGVKNAAAIRWEADGPREFLGLGKGELMVLRERKGDLEAIALFRALKSAEAMEDCVTLVKELHDKGKRKELEKLLKDYGLRLPKLLRYTEEQRLEKQSRRTVLMEYIDYAQAAIGIGLDIRNPVIAWPKCFREKHDSVTKAYARLQEERKNERQWELYRPRYKKLEKKYAFVADGLEIRVPLNSSEIAEEGRKLHHCVGGYADRHMRGATTILFLRRAAQRDTPLVTIEMRGNKIVQIHGYDDERTACPENPNRTPCRRLYDYFLEPWLQWLSAGSKRDKEGIPVLKEDIHERSTYEKIEEGEVLQMLRGQAAG